MLVFRSRAWRAIGLRHAGMAVADARDVVVGIQVATAARVGHPDALCAGQLDRLLVAEGFDGGPSTLRGGRPSGVGRRGRRRARLRAELEPEVKPEGVRPGPEAP